MPKSSQRRNDTRRQNKDRRARLDELRKQQRAAERRKNFLFMGSAILVGVLLVGGAVTLALVHDAAAKAKNKAGHQSAPTADEKAAGCLGVHNDPVATKDRNHLTTPIDYTKSKYGDNRSGALPIPPSGGNHNANTLPANTFYPLSQQPRPERAVHDMEHGYVVVWYDSKLPGDQVAHLQALATQPAYNHLLVVGWWQGDLPLGKHLAMTSWGRTERCGSESDKVISAFYQAHVNSPLTPEPGSTMAGDSALPAGQLNPPTAPATSPTPTPSKKK